MDSKMADIRGTFKDIYSSMIVLQDAVCNENKIIEFDQVDDMLEILIEQMGNTLDKFDNLWTEVSKLYFEE